MVFVEMKIRREYKGNVVRKNMMNIKSKHNSSGRPCAYMNSSTIYIYIYIYI